MLPNGQSCTPHSVVQGNRTALQPAARLLSLASDAQPRATPEPPPPSPAAADAASPEAASPAAAGGPQQQFIPAGSSVAGDGGRSPQVGSRDGDEGQKPKRRRSRHYRNKQVRLRDAIALDNGGLCALQSCHSMLPFNAVHMLPKQDFASRGGAHHVLGSHEDNRPVAKIRVGHAWALYRLVFPSDLLHASNAESCACIRVP